jgi:acetamidase/formamidase
MTETTTIDRNQWVDQLDSVTRDHEGDDVTIEVLDSEWGDAHEAQRMPFTYVNYDQKDDAVIIGVGGHSGSWPVVLRHIVWHPTEVSIAPVGDETALRITEQDGTVTLVTIRPAAS